jgi:tRNA dimethylallyltransferase
MPPARGLPDNAAMSIEPPPSPSPAAPQGPLFHPLCAQGPVLCLAGPTASGKTGLAVHLAQALGASGQRVEIISVDSALVYQGMDIGSAKPNLQERGGIAHHLIDILPPEQAYSAARFCQDASAAIAAIHQSGGLPLLVGGTLLYFKALFEGLDALPASDASLRAELQAQCQALGIEALHAQLAEIDPPTAQRLPPTDTQRILRALEVYRLSGQPLSALHTRGPQKGQGQSPPHAAWPLLSLEPSERDWLHQRIRLRFEAMLASGFLEEVRSLRLRSGLHADLPSMRCVGYRQAWEALEAGCENDPAWVERGIAATRQLAKRQITWLRSMTQRTPLACEHPELRSQATQWALAQIKAWNSRQDAG